MIDVLTTISIVFGYILIGYIVKKTHVIPLKIEKIFTNLSFNVLLPLALITNFWLITFPDTKRLLLKEEYNNGIKEGNWIEYDGNNFNISREVFSYIINI